MKRGPTGDYEITAAGGEQVRAFVPWPLPPRPALVLDDALRDEGDWEAWLRFFLEGVELTAGEAVATTRRLLRLFDEDAALIRARGERRTATLLAVHEALRRRPVVALGALAERAGVSFPTAAKACEQLMALGLVDELTGGRRNRLFGYRRYLAILNEGMEPL